MYIYTYIYVCVHVCVCKYSVCMKIANLCFTKIEHFSSTGTHIYKRCFDACEVMYWTPYQALNFFSSLSSTEKKTSARSFVH